MSFPSAISRVARSSIGRKLLLSSTSSSSSSSSFPSTSSFPPSSRRPLSTSTSRDPEDRISVGSPSSSYFSRPRSSSPRRMPSSSRPNSSPPPSNSFPPSNRGKIIRARAQDKLVEGSFGLLAPLSTPAPYLAPTSLASVPQSPKLPRTLNLNLDTLAWFQTITPPNWNRLLRTLDPPTHFEYKRKVKYLRRALTKPLPAMRAAYLEHASKFLKRQDEEEALLRAGGNVRRIAGPTTMEKSEEGFTKYVKVFNKSTRRELSSAEWFLLSEEEKVVKRLEARERLIEETPEGEEREKLLRRLEVMDKGKEERARKKREEEEREGETSS